MTTLIEIGIFISIALVIVILLYRRNKKDQKLIDPNTEDAVSEVMMDQQRRKDKI